MSYIPHSEGSLYVYDNVTATTIDAADQYHGITVLGAGSAQLGTTITAGATGAITNTADNTVLRCTDVAHGLTTGQYVTLTGMGDAAHVGVTRVTVIDVDTFDCDDIAYNSAADTGTWNRGSAITIDSGHGGTYIATWSASMLSAGNSKNYQVEAYVNATAQDEFAGERKISVAGDLGNASATGIITAAGGAVVWLAVKGTTDATNCTFQHLNLSIHKV
jgi:hypothetical protein